jgi:hypothetical protein
MKENNSKLNNAEYMNKLTDGESILRIIHYKGLISASGLDGWTHGLLKVDRKWLGKIIGVMMEATLRSRSCPE